MLVLEDALTSMIFATDMSNSLVAPRTIRGTAELGCYRVKALTRGASIFR
jgi:hypothetical protein